MSDIRIETDGPVLAITFTRPDRRNAITVAMYAAMADAIEGAAGNDAIRLITIRGEGQDFTAGNDLHDFLTALPRISDDIPVWRLLRALARNTVPIVASVQGNAVGIGTTLLLHCDLVVAEEDAQFLLPFVDLGLVPEAASTLILPELAGRRRAARYLLLGDAFGAAEALDIGLVSHVAAPGKREATFQKIVDRLLAKPPQALRLTQQLLREGTADAVLERMEVEGDHFSERLQSDEVKAAIAAFFAAKAKGA
ncbi:enoyl-CoA hydratase [Sphingomonas sabuli]|uniref:Enoyl-CoA hydratase n=1 Tax=Sphingomonas sabuli TaxID=2764186 RepID=A0A7G9L4S9_9SPHN|nr:enoyl-CoA hydratase [Sphingomonas sabuli]QNM83628.1 enoyl-CoA hydratase [Sphingomonas sabuli]